MKGARTNKFWVFVLVLSTLLVPMFATPSSAQPQDPYIIEVFVYDENGTAVSGAIVTVTHLPTGESRTVSTDTDGWCWVALDNMTYYEIGDQVRITATKGDLVAETTITVDSTDEGGEVVYLTLAEPTIPPVTGVSAIPWWAIIVAILIFVGFIWWLRGGDKE